MIHKGIHRLYTLKFVKGIQYCTGFGSYSCLWIYGMEERWRISHAKTAMKKLKQEAKEVHYRVTRCVFVNVFVESLHKVYAESMLWGELLSWNTNLAAIDFAGWRARGLLFAKLQGNCSCVDVAKCCKMLFFAFGISVFESRKKVAKADGQESEGSGATLWVDQLRASS